MTAKLNRDALSAAECAATIYRNADLTTFYRAHPDRVERLVREVTVAQRKAAEKLLEQVDVEGSDRFLRMEIALRMKVLEDLEALPPESRQSLSLERVRQITYLIQGYERSGDPEAIDKFLKRADYEYFQPQVIDSWLRSLYRCPDWKALTTLEELTDVQLRQAVCRPACTPRARDAINSIEAWRSKFRTDWEKYSGIRALHRRLAVAVKSCRPE